MMNNMGMMGQNNMMNPNSNQMEMGNPNMNQSMQNQMGFMGQNQMNPSKKTNNDL